jgi:hypothetical protein
MVWPAEMEMSKVVEVARLRGKDRAVTPLTGNRKRISKRTSSGIEWRKAGAVVLYDHAAARGEEVSGACIQQGNGFDNLVVEVACSQPKIRRQGDNSRMWQRRNVATAECSKQSTNFVAKAVVMTYDMQSGIWSQWKGLTEHWPRVQKKKTM